MKAAAAAVVLAASLVPTAFGRDLSQLGIGYICGAEHLAAPRDGPRTLEIEDGIGAEGFSVRTRSAQAQRWFDYGVTLWHAFYHEDSKLAFDKAVQADPDCGMCLWGKALSRGPTLNFDLDPGQQKAAAALADKALAAARTPLERALAEALRVRYAASQDAAAEEAFAGALLKAAPLQPDAQDLRLIAAEALLTAYRRGDHAGTAQRAMSIVQPILKQEPDNVAAIHYWIHATEMAGQPALALPYARRLADLAPRASHLVHMASHTYLRLGLYEQAAAINAKALNVDARHAEATNLPGPLGAPDYYPHNLSMGLEAALMSGDAPLAVKFADDARLALKARQNAAYVIDRTLIAYGRCAPERALSLPAPAGDDFGLAMWRYARGEAFAARGEAGAVAREAEGLARQLKAQSTLNAFERAQVDLAERVLEGRAAMLDGHPQDAARIYRAAAEVQERFHWGMDPPPWWYPVRRSLAAAELQEGRAGDAVKDAEASLGLWPRDGLALQVLAQAQTARGEIALGRRTMADARKRWRGARLPLDRI